MVADEKGLAEIKYWAQKLIEEVEGRGKTDPMPISEYQMAKRAFEQEAEIMRLRSALETLAEVEWDEWEEDMSAIAFKFVLLSQAGLPDEEMDLESESVKKLYPKGVPGIGEFIRAVLEGSGE